MAKWANDLCMDAALDYIAACTRIFVVTTAVTTWTAASSGALAKHTLTSGDFAKADNTSASAGRKVTVAQQATITVAASGTAKYVCLGFHTGPSLRYRTSCTSQALVKDNTVTVPAWAIKFYDPV